MRFNILRTSMAVAAFAAIMPMLAAPAAAKTCKPYSVSAAGEKKLTNLGARVSARWHWHRKVLKSTGFVWSTYVLASNKYYQCSRSGLKWKCSANARPCKA
jgi:hypothetical protein